MRHRTLPKLAEIERHCTKSNVRMTRQRRLVIRVIEEARDHPDVPELHRRAQRIDPRVSLPTVYRNIALLEQLGVLQRHRFNDGRSRYEIVSQRHHDHLIDVESGRVIEFQSPEIERLQAVVARRHGFRLVDHRLELYVVRLEQAKPHKA